MDNSIYRWVISNERLPETNGFYYCEDSIGQKTMVNFYDNHWHSLTGHPVTKWLEEIKVEPDQQELWNEIFNSWGSHCVFPDRNFVIKNLLSKYTIIPKQ